MSQERPTEITPESQDLINKVYPEADVGRLQEWLVGSTHGQSLIGELEKNTHDVKNAGISRLGILVEACANHHFRKDFDRDDRLPPDVRTELGLQILEITAKKALSGEVGEQTVKDKMAEIYNEGVGEVELAEGFNVFQIQESAATELANVVEEVVADWVANDSLQMQLRTAKLKYQAREQALIDSNKRTEEAKKEFAALEETALAQTSFIEDLQRRLRIAEAGGGNWNDERKKQLETLFASEPDKVRNQIAAALKRLDPIKDRQVEKQMEEPENLAETDKTLLEKFGKLEGLDSGKLVAAGISNEVMGSLAQILRLQLEQRRAGQETTRQNNREKKAVRDYFAEHTPTIEVNKKDGIIIDDGWQVNLERAEVLGYEPLNDPDSIVGLKIDTKLEDITGLSIFLKGKAGRINKIFLESQRLKKDSDQYDRESRLNLIALDETRKEFRLVRQFSEGKQTFFVYKADRKIGTLGFSDAGLLINWEEMSLREGLEAVVNVVNLLEETPWGGDKRLKGLVLTTTTKGGEKKAEPPKPEASAPTAEEPQPPMAKTEREPAKEDLGF